MSTDSTLNPSLNQYAPPTADVADVAPTAEFDELKLFSAKGRIGRLRYLAYSTGAALLQGLGGAVLALGGVRGASFDAISWLVLAVLLWFTIITGIKRCHDINASGWWTLTVFIPVIALIWVFWPGDRGANRFGPPPPPNTWGVRLLGVIAPVVFFVGILAAVAIPAYQQYVNKARAAQVSGQR